MKKPQVKASIIKGFVRLNGSHRSANQHDGRLHSEAVRVALESAANTNEPHYESWNHERTKMKMKIIPTVSALSALALLTGCEINRTLICVNKK